MVCAVGQRDGRLFRVFKELVLEEGDIGLMCELFVEAFPRHYGEIWIYGDATGRGRAAQTGKSCYDLIQNAMRTYGSPIRLKVPLENPFVVDRIGAVNMILKDEWGHQLIEIDPSCGELIADLEGVLRDSRGGIKKTHDRKDPYYRRTHLSDAIGYWISKEEPVRRVSTTQSQGPVTVPSPGYAWNTQS
jgi:hypothetical protein